MLLCVHECCTLRQELLRDVPSGQDILVQSTILHLVLTRKRVPHAFREHRQPADAIREFVQR